MPDELRTSTTVATRKTERRSSPRRAEFIVIECITPQLDGGRHPVKRIVGDRVSVGADLIQAGHDTLGGRVMSMGPGDADWSPSSMLYDHDSDRWYGAFVVDRIGRWKFTVEAWTDRFATWRSGLEKKVKAGQDVQLELSEGAQMARAASRSTRVATARASLLLTAKMLEDRRDTALEKRIQRALDEDLFALMQEHLRPTDLTRSHTELTIIVERELARASAWYELFPRSQTTLVPGETPRHGSFDDAAARLPRLAELGFDVVYLPPIHPIGHTFRKGKNNSLTPEPDDVGSPWAIGNEAGGHTAIDPALGTLADFDRFVETARGMGLEVALDYALQCSPDHPWVKEHPDWFHVRPDGSIQYAENPPKKYQDIYPLDFETEKSPELWEELKSVVLYWIEQGVRIFRVDNPHTKPFDFWEWLITDIKSRHPDVLFLAEAFTRPKVMYELAKLGFSQSYTYFAWRNAKQELTEYFTELTQTDVREYFRPNLWPNTPDILTEFLQQGGRPAFMIRLLLAATLGANYGIYGPAFELGEHLPVREGSEEYLDSEKYQVRHWDLNNPASVAELITRTNQIRRENPALHADLSLRFHSVDNQQLIAYSKTSDDLLNIIVAVVNLDPYHTQAGMIDLPLDLFHLDARQPYQMHDLLTDTKYVWRGPRNYVELNPQRLPAHIFCIRRRVRTENGVDYFV